MMASPRIEYAVLPAGHGPGQDRCFTAEGLVVVLDGASAYEPGVSPDAGVYVDTLGPALLDLITSHPRINLREALARAIRLTAERLTLDPGKGPSSTVSIVRWSEGAVDILVLGDSPVVVQFTDGSHETLVQDTLDHVAPELRRLYRQRLAAGHGYDDQHQAILAQIQRAEAPARNTAEGYWIAEAEPVCASHAISVSRPPTLVNKVVVATDGSKSLVPTILERADAPRGRSWLQTQLSILFEWELKVDPDGRLAPRSKRHDDKTVAVIYNPSV